MEIAWAFELGNVFIDSRAPSFPLVRANILPLRALFQSTNRADKRKETHVKRSIENSGS